MEYWGVNLQLVEMLDAGYWILDVGSFPFHVGHATFNFELTAMSLQLYSPVVRMVFSLDVWGLPSIDSGRLPSA